MDPGAVPDADRIAKRNTFADLKRAYYLKTEEKIKNEEVIRSYVPLLLYTNSVNHSGPMRKGKYAGKNFIPLSLYTTTVDQPGPMCEGNKSSESKIFPTWEGNKSSESKVSRNNFGPIVKGQSSESKVSRNSIPDRVALSVLSKLPVKSLKRFECLRKSWSILFENSDFMTMYTNHFISSHCSDSHDYHSFILSSHIDWSSHIGRPDYIYLSEFHLLDNTVKFNLPPPFSHSGGALAILNSTSVKGIFCLAKDFMENVQYGLWNPATQEFILIPSSPAELLPKRPVSNLYLKHYFHGFGYDQLRDDLKVVQYASSYDCKIDTSNYMPVKSFFEIYSLKSNSWRSIDMNNDLLHWSYPPPFHGQEVYLDGACHWLVPRIFNVELVELTLLSFDLSHEVFFTTPIGEGPLCPFEPCLTVLNGSIALFANYDKDTIFHIYILGELGVSQSWIKLYISKPLPTLRWPPVGFGKTGCIFFTKNNSTKKNYELAYFDLSTQIIHDVGITLGEKSFFIIGLYKESLLQLEDQVISFSSSSSIGGSSH